MNINNNQINNSFYKYNKNIYSFKNLSIIKTPIKLRKNLQIKKLKQLPKINPNYLNKSFTHNKTTKELKTQKNNSFINFYNNYNNNNNNLNNSFYNISTTSSYNINNINNNIFKTPNVADRNSNLKRIEVKKSSERQSSIKYSPYINKYNDNLNNIKNLNAQTAFEQQMSSKQGNNINVNINNNNSNRRSINLSRSRNNSIEKLDINQKNFGRYNK